MVLEHIGMPQPGDCRVVFSASAEELEAAIQAEQAAIDNEATKLQMVAMLQQAEQRLIAGQRQDTNLRLLSSTNTAMPEIK